MRNWADLEIGLHRRDAERYTVEMRFSPPDSEAEVNPLPQGTPPMRLDFQRLRADAEDQGRVLGDSLFAVAAVRDAFGDARAAAEAADVPLRVRLFIGPSAPELHNLRWETLQDTRAETPLFAGEKLLFSRYISSPDFRPVSLRPQSDLRSLVAIASPNNVGTYSRDDQPLPSLDVPGELKRAKDGLGDIETVTLASGGTATLNKIVETLREGFDILYLVCHGLMDEEPRLLLEDEYGNAALVSGNELATRLNELQDRPRLVVLASCQSAGTGGAARADDNGALSALGPKLAQFGLPAVVAMQGNVSMATIARFMPLFFRELRRDGQIDRAMAAGRGATLDAEDWWMPVLFMRLKSGRIWYSPGFSEGEALRKWPSLLDAIENHRCTPILGPGLSESVFGSRRELAVRWAEKHNFPLHREDRDNLPRVAQFLAVQQDPAFPGSQLLKALRDTLRQRMPDLPADSVLSDLVTEAGARRRNRDPNDSHRVLAELPFTIYITSDPSSLLTDALKAANREPTVMTAYWKDDMTEPPSAAETGYKPDVQHPLVYHLFGRLEDQDSLVLTEDDYFDYLIGITNNKAYIPTVVKRALSDSALLFLGFQMTDWDFRVLFRSIMNQQGGKRRAKYAHIAVQIDPEEDRIAEPEQARKFLQEYFQTAAIYIYWGGVQEFVRELQKYRRQNV